MIEKLWQNGLKDKVWELVLEQIKTQMTSATFDTWFFGVNLLEITNDMVAIIQVPNQIRKHSLETNFKDTVEKALQIIVGQEITVKFVQRRN